MIKILTKLGRFLRIYRINNNEILKDMAERLNISPSYLSSIENGKRNPTKKFISKLCKTYNFKSSEIDELKGVVNNDRETY